MAEYSGDFNMGSSQKKNVQRKMGPPKKNRIPPKQQHMQNIQVTVDGTSNKRRPGINFKRNEEADAHMRDSSYRKSQSKVSDTVVVNDFYFFLKIIKFFPFFFFLTLDNWV